MSEVGGMVIREERWVVVETIALHFVRHRGWVLSKPVTEEDVSRSFARVGYHIVSAASKGAVAASNDAVAAKYTFLILDSDIDKDKAIKALNECFRSDEPVKIYVVVPEAVLKKCKNYALEYSKQMGRKGLAEAFSYTLFVTDIIAGCAPHRILGEDEAAAVLNSLWFTPEDLCIIYDSDPPIVWIGGKPGQIVEIRSFSETAGESVTYRRIKRAA